MASFSQYTGTPAQQRGSYGSYALVHILPYTEHTGHHNL